MSRVYVTIISLKDTRLNNSRPVGTRQLDLVGQCCDLIGIVASVDSFDQQAAHYLDSPPCR